MVAPEIGEGCGYRFAEDTGRCGLAVDTRMSAREIARLHRAALEEPEFDGSFDRDERRLDDERVVATSRRVSAPASKRQAFRSWRRAASSTSSPGSMSVGRRSNAACTSSMSCSMRVLLIGEDLFAERSKAVAPVHRDSLGEDLAEFRAGSARALRGFDILFEHEAVTVEAFGLEISNDVGDLPAGCRPVAIDDDETIDVALAVSLAPSDAPENNDTEEIVDVVGVSERGLHAVNECPDRCMEFRLRNSKYRIVLLESVGVDRNMVSLWRLSNLNSTDTVEEVYSPPDRRAGDTRGVDKFGDRKLCIMGVGEQSKDVVCGTDTKDIGIRVGIRIDADRYILFRHFRHYLILCNDI